LVDLFKFSRQVSEKSSNIKFPEIPSSGNRVVPRGQTDGRENMRKLIVTFHNIANAPQNCKVPGSNSDQTDGLHK